MDNIQKSAFYTLMTQHAGSLDREYKMVQNNS